MVNKQLNKQHGFTLVEIAIVLVIIGLLLGGILKGQELITAARVRSLADLGSGVQTAYYGFIDRYRAIPGDMQETPACTAIGGTACTATGGDGDKTIESFVEASGAWSHMTAAGFLQGAYPGTATDEDTYITPATTPEAPTNPWGGLLLLGNSGDYLPTDSPSRLHLIMGRDVPVNIMRELDVKMDDTFPESGILRSAPAAATVFKDVGDSDAACVDTTPTPAVWDIALAKTNCNGYYLY